MESGRKTDNGKKGNGWAQRTFISVKNAVKKNKTRRKFNNLEKNTTKPFTVFTIPYNNHNTSIIW